LLPCIERLYNSRIMKSYIHKSFPKTVLIFLIILTGAWGSGFCDSSQSWLNNSATFTISSKLDLKLTQESRYLDIAYANPYLKNVQGGMVFKLPKNFYFATLYKREHVEIGELGYNEDRYTLEGGWKTKVAEKLDFDIRFRTEIREFDEDRVEDHLRFRLRLRLRTQLSIGKLKLKPFVAAESFGKTKVNTIQRSRLYIGTNFPLSDHVEFSLSYLWLATRGDESIHILHSGFELKF
jgi:hypothetical protein